MWIDRERPVKRDMVLETLQSEDWSRIVQAKHHQDCQQNTRS